jgi:CheY-specific phosphatase CheX
MPNDPLNSESISHITQTFWGTMAATSLSVVETLPVRTEFQEGVSGTVEIRGAWAGSVVLHASRSLAVSTACVLLEKETPEITVEECFDAIQESTNIIAGGIKRLLPSICKLAIPAMSGCSALVPKALPPAALVTLFTSSAGDLCVMVVPEHVST